MTYKGFSVFQFWDCEWVVAKSFEEGKIFLYDLTSSQEVLDCEEYILDEKELERLIFRHGDIWDKSAKSESFLARFKSVVDENPTTQYFATTEY